jgi:drug/metabolite transporter (DMT)-like permease
MTSTERTPNRWLIPIAFLCVYFFWGSTFVAIRYGVQYLTPPFVSGFRYLFAALMMMGYMWARKQSLAISRRELIRAFILAMLLLTGNNVLLGWAEEYLTAGYAALLTASVPLLIAIAESIIPGGTPLNRLGWAGTILGLGGLVLLLAPVLRNGLTLHNTSDADHALSLGTMILIVGIASWVIGSLLSGRNPSTLDPFVASAWQMLIAGTVNIFIGTAIGGWSTAHWTPGVFAAIGWLTIFGSLVGYSAYTYLLHNVPVAKVATYAYVNPIVAVVLSAIFLHEGLHGSQWVAMAIILVAVAIVTASKSKPAPATETES